MKKGVERERGKVIVLHISVVSLYHGLFVAFLMILHDKFSMLYLQLYFLLKIVGVEGMPSINSTSDAVTFS